MEFIEINSYIHSDIQETNYILYGEKERIDYLGPIENVNIFVGSNNSGKSRFLRGLLKSSKFALTSNNGLASVLDNCIEYIKSVKTNFDPQRLISFTVRPLNVIKNEYKPVLNSSHTNISLENQSKKEIPLSFHLQYINRIEKILSDIKTDRKNFKPNINVLKTTTLELDIGIDLCKIENKELINQITSARNIYVANQLYSIKREFLDSLILLKNELVLLSQYKLNLIEPTKKTYIPILRSANSIYSMNQGGVHNKIENDIFKHTLEKIYNLNDLENSQIEVFTGLNLYRSIRRTRNNVKQIRDNFSKFEKFLSQYFFEGNQVDIVAIEEENKEDEHIKIFIGGDERNIHDLGDGIQSIIILMYSIFTADKNSWIFIEEPEINLHPGLQRIFLNQIISNPFIVKKNLKYFITTHSNHLLDLSISENIPLSIFTFDKKYSEEKSYHEVKNVKSKNFNILSKLGIRSSSVFLSNCSIWVEGITDRMYIQGFLLAYFKSDKNIKRFNEDIDYSFFEYAGSNISHYLFGEEENLFEESILKNEKIKAQFLSNRIFLVADKDKGKEKKHLELASKENEYFKYHVTDGREIENLISSVQLKNYIKFLSSKFKDHSIIFNRSHFKSLYIGEYLENKLGKNKTPKSFKAESGTLSNFYKNKLAKIMSNNMKWDEMSSSAQELTEELYKFIKASNI